MTVHSWGRGEDGQLGQGDTNDHHEPALVDALKDKGVVHIACGSGHTVVLAADGEVRGAAATTAASATATTGGSTSPVPSRR